MTISSAAFLAVSLTWAVMWFFHLRPRWLRGMKISSPAPEFPGRISIIIPARNEQENLPALLATLTGEADPELEIIVVDDHSTDGTGGCVKEAMKKDSRIRLVECPEKPDGWAGKPWAVTQAHAHATGDWLLFADADIVLDPLALSVARGVIVEENLDCLSLLPGMKSFSLAGALLTSCYSMSRAILFRPAAPGRHGLVQGAFLCVRRRAYDDVGGHERLRHSLLEDVELGDLLQESGHRVRAYHARRLLGTPMPEHFGATWEGLKKHLFPVLGYSFRRSIAAVAIHLSLFVVPLLLVAASAISPLLNPGPNPDAAAVFSSGLITLAIMYVMIFRTTAWESLPALSKVLVPFSYVLFGILLWESARGYRSGSIPWKGRYYRAGCFDAPGEKGLS